MKITVAVALIVVSLLTACAEERDDSTCQSYGLQVGTPSYVNCREQLQQQRSDRRAAFLATGGFHSTANQTPTYNVPTNNTTTCMPFAGGVRCQ